MFQNSQPSKTSNTTATKSVLTIFKKCNNFITFLARKKFNYKRKLVLIVDESVAKDLNELSFFNVVIDYDKINFDLNTDSNMFCDQKVLKRSQIGDNPFNTLPLKRKKLKKGSIPVPQFIDSD